MQTILNFIWEYRLVIIALVGFTAYVIFNPEYFKKKVIEFELIAKSMAKDGVLRTSQEQADWVLESVITYLGNSKRWGFIVNLIGRDRMKSIVKVLYDSAFDMLDDGKINGSYKSK